VSAATVSLVKLAFAASSILAVVSNVPRPCKLSAAVLLAKGVATGVESLDHPSGTSGSCNSGGLLFFLDFLTLATVPLLLLLLLLLLRILLRLAAKPTP